MVLVLYGQPVLMGADFLVPCLLCGNGVMYKPSEFSTLSGKLLASLLYEGAVESYHSITRKRTARESTCFVCASQLECLRKYALSS